MIVRSSLGFFKLGFIFEISLKKIINWFIALYTFILSFSLTKHAHPFSLRL
jgi:hypothetical protein